MLFEDFENWEEVGRCGNFLIKHNVDEELDYYAVKTTLGHQSFVFRQDHPWWNLFDLYAKGKVEDKAVETYLSLLFMQMSIIPDEKFVVDYIAIYESACARYEEGRPASMSDDIEIEELNTEQVEEDKPLK